ncbi:nucleotide exchange factor GrpE [Nocardiopsis sp. RSe5-2]|uniref:Protein GrpE n=1 Tax=Nocardiopsis endophytica TaxID=3018445 RepID=A0ABT4U9A7_9ACTN|nr:nucleotide exchange factor GrpE [Nocardiopsis endophytica]MDA2813306.1 nucleotide exchange factor GrpE [Nocardiopsis endophytica]
MALPDYENGEAGEGPVIRDKRRVDPETGELRTPDGAAPEQEADAPAEEEAAGAPGADQRVTELTNDLKRLQAEYANYRKRVDRDRAAVKEQAVAQVAGELLPILDDIGRAREHDELTGGFKSVGEALESVVVRLGLTKYGESGDAFDPTVHEALTMVPQPGVEAPTVIEVFQPGYLIGERVLRPARVVVAGPAEEADGDGEGSAEESAPAAEAAPEAGDDEEKK